MADEQLSVNPTELISAAADLDRLAERLEKSLGGAEVALRTPAAGRDEVSVTTATNFTTVAESFGKDAATGVLELRKIAAVLRAQASGVSQAEDEVAAAFRL